MLQVVADSRFSRAALLLFLLAFFALAGHGRAEASASRLSWRSVTAPSTATPLLAFVSVQPPGDTGEEGDEDSIPVTKDPTAPEGTPPPASPPPTFSPNPAALETLGPPAAAPVLRGANTPTPLPTGPRPRRGILGIHPLALLAALVALHIFVITTVVK